MGKTGGWLFVFVQEFLFLGRAGILCKADLRELVRKYALEVKPEGEFFVLKSGEKSRYYLDCRNLNLTPEGLRCVVRMLMDRLEHVEFDAVGGPSLGADPIVGGLCFLSGERGRDFRCFLVRKEEKGHAKGGRIVGPLRPGDRCVIVEDVSTTGGSTLDAIKAVEDFGASVVHVFAVVDRMRGGREAFADRGIPFTPLITIEDLGL